MAQWKQVSFCTIPTANRKRLHQKGIFDKMQTFLATTKLLAFSEIFNTGKHRSFCKSKGHKMVILCSFLRNLYLSFQTTLVLRIKLVVKSSYWKRNSFKTSTATWTLAGSNAWSQVLPYGQVHQKWQIIDRGSQQGRFNIEFLLTVEVLCLLCQRQITQTRGWAEITLFFLDKLERKITI